MAVFLVIMTYSIGDVLLARGMKRIGAIVTFNWSMIGPMTRDFMGNGPLWGGLICELVALLIYLLALSRADLSLVLPATALSDVVVALAAKYFLREYISARRWAGIFLITFGVALISLP